MLEEVDEGHDGVGPGVARQAGHVEEAHARGVVDPDGGEHDEDREYDRGDDHEQRCHTAEEAVLPLILMLRRVHAQADADHDREHRRDGEQLDRGPDAARDGAVDRVARRGQAKIALEDDIVQPVPKALDDRGLDVVVRLIARARDRLLRGARRAGLIVRARVHE